MPKLVHKSPALCHHKASGRAKVRYGGKDYYLGAYGTPEAQEAYDRFVADLTKPKADPSPEPAPTPDRALLVSELVVLFRKHARKFYVDADGNPTGQHFVIRAVLVPLTEMYGGHYVHEFGPKKLKTLQEAMAERPSWSRVTVNRATSIIKQMVTWGASEELYDAKYAVALSTVGAIREGQYGAKERPAVEPVSDQTVAATLPHIAPVPADIVRLMRLTGARPIELRRLTAAEIDRSDPELWKYRPRRHKTAHKNKKRVILFDKRCQAILAPYLMRAGQHGLLFKIARSVLRQAVLRGCRRAFPHPELSKIGPKKRTPRQQAELTLWHKQHAWNPYRLRHSAATETRELFGLEATQGLCGHANRSMTERYAGVDISKTADAVRAIGRGVVG